ncbi:MAG: hypothetical protein NC342_05260 [Pseudoflavonifractor sp.]|nr:hypothetical protein [Alloprevotella sp.]MCM1116925.1 hypothetical protein [Pseudoflavonifractor sp.]
MRFKHSLGALAVAAALGLSPAASAQSVIFPSQTQPGAASLTEADGTITLANDLLSASFIKGANNTLAFGGCSALGLLPGGDIFKIQLADGTVFSGSEIQWETITSGTAYSESEFAPARASIKILGQMIEAKGKVSGMDLTWRAVLRDGSHYLRTEIELTNPESGEAVPMASLTPMIYSADPDVIGDMAIVGNTRGALLASPKVFAGIETPMGQNSVAPQSANVKNLSLTGWTSINDWMQWKPETLPSAIGKFDDSGEVTPTVSNVNGMHGYVYFPEAGEYTATFVYTSGNIRIDLLGVELNKVDDSSVKVTDYHHGYYGSAHADNVYTLNVTEPGIYETIYYRSHHKGDNNTTVGTITWAGPAQPQLAEITIDKGVSTPSVEYSTESIIEAPSTSWKAADWKNPTDAEVTPKAIIFTAAATANSATPFIRQHEQSFTTANEGVISAYYAYSSGAHARYFTGASLYKVEGDSETLVKHLTDHKKVGSNANITYNFGSQPAGQYKVVAYSAHNATSGTNNGNNTSTYNVSLDGTVIDGTSGTSTSGAGWTVPANPELVPEQLGERFADLKADEGTRYIDLLTKIGVISKNIIIGGSDPASLSVVIGFSSGNNRICPVGVALFDENNDEIAADYHFGFVGSNPSNNTYTLSDITPGNYTLRFYIEERTETALNATGTFTFNCSADLKENFGEITQALLTLPFDNSVKMQGLWARSASIQPGKTWEVGSVVGLIADAGTGGADQSRRSVLAYIERERAVPWRSMPIYNSWYELNIGRNNDANYTNHMKPEECLEVIQQWYDNLYKKNGTNIGAFVWDDGWDSYGTWTFNPNFPNGFTEIDEKARTMGTGLGAWLGPVGGYGNSGNMRRKYWTDRGQEMQLANPDYYKVFNDAIDNLANKLGYDFRYFKFDGISALNPATGPGNTESAEAIIDIETQARKARPDIFLNTTVGTWASPFWYRYTDATWRQGEDCKLLSGAQFGDGREAWISYRDNMVYDKYVKDSPLCPINSMMTHGFILTNASGTGGTAAGLPRDYDGIVREMRAAFACGTGQVELYADYALMNSITKEGKEPGDLWKEMADGIKWQRANADVLPDIHWVGGDPSDAAIYGWASWNGRKATLALRNPKTSEQTFTFTLRQALELPGYCSSTFTFTKAFEDQAALTGLTEDTELEPDTEITVTLPANSIFVFNGIDSNYADAPIETDYNIVVDNEVEYTLTATEAPYPGKEGVMINKTLTPEPLDPYHFTFEVPEDGKELVTVDEDGNVSFWAPGETTITVKAMKGEAPAKTEEETEGEEEAEVASLMAISLAGETTSDETADDPDMLASYMIDVTIPAATVTAQNIELILARDHDEYNHVALPATILTPTSAADTEGFVVASSDFTLPSVDELQAEITLSKGLGIDNGELKVTGQDIKNGTLDVKIVKKDSDPLVTYGSLADPVSVTILDAVKTFEVSSEFPSLLNVGDEPVDLAEFITLEPGHEKFVNVKHSIVLAEDNDAEAAKLEESKLSVDGDKLTDGSQTATITISAPGKDPITKTVELHRLISEITLTASKTSNFKKGDEFTLTPSFVTADNGTHTETLTWSFEGDDILSVDEQGKVTITGDKGEATVTVTASPSGISQCFVVKVGGDPVIVGIDTIDMDFLSLGAEIYTVSGRRVASESIQSLAPGIYILRLSDGRVVKLMK